MPLFNLEYMPAHSFDSYYWGRYFIVCHASLPPLDFSGQRALFCFPLLNIYHRFTRSEYILHLPDWYYIIYFEYSALRFLRGSFHYYFFPLATFHYVEEVKWSATLVYFSVSRIAQKSGDAGFKIYRTLLIAISACFVFDTFFISHSLIDAFDYSFSTRRVFSCLATRASWPISIAAAAAIYSLSRFGHFLLHSMVWRSYLFI